jgi:hypothetical protein
LNAGQSDFSSNCRYIDLFATIMGFRFQLTRTPSAITTTHDTFGKRSVSSNGSSSCGGGARLVWYDPW